MPERPNPSLSTKSQPIENKPTRPRRRPFDIFVSAADGTGVRQLTNDRANDRNPTRSPDGKQIVFMSNRDGGNQIWSIRPDGSGLRRLTASSAGAQSYNRWSHDGSKLTFETDGTADGDKMFVFDPRMEWNDQTPRAISVVVGPGRYFNGWSWSPNGQQLAGTAGTEETVDCAGQVGAVVGHPR